jgi:hypothetical protein
MSSVTLLDQYIRIRRTLPPNRIRTLPEHPHRFRGQQLPSRIRSLVPRQARLCIIEHDQPARDIIGWRLMRMLHE